MNRKQRRASGLRNDRLDLTVRAADNKVIVEFNVMLRWLSLTIPEAEAFLLNIQQQVINLKQAQAVAVAKENM